MTEPTVSRSQSLSLAMKRVLDIFVSAAMLILSAPLILLIAVVIKVESRGPIFFVHKRAGLRGKQIHVIRFRTMLDNRVDQSTFLAEIITDKGRTADFAGRLFKMQQDPRITRSGKLLRRLSLDQLPELINVLKGDLSLVGPRAVLPYEVKLYDEHQKLRLKVKPGITGLWQTTTRRESLAFDRMMEVDLEYVAKWNLWLDIKILLMSIPLAFRPSVSA